MGYDIQLIEDGNIVNVSNHSEGGIIAIGGSSTADISITYNYGYFFRKSLSPRKGIRWLYGKKAKDTVKRLAKAIKELGVKKDSDYWKATPGNAGHILSVLLKWAKQHPNAIWEGD